MPAIRGAFPIHIGNQTRNLLVTTSSTFHFKTWMPGNLGLREAMVLHREPAVVACAIAAMLRHEDPKIAPLKVMAWIDAERARYPEFEAAAVLAAEAYYRDVGVVEPGPGEAGAPAAAPSASGSTSSMTPAATASPSLPSESPAS